VSVIVRDRTSDDEAWVHSVLRLNWGSSLVARLGELIDASALPGSILRSPHCGTGGIEVAAPTASGWVAVVPTDAKTSTAES
jgi:hypothetical protein